MRISFSVEDTEADIAELDCWYDMPLWAYTPDEYVRYVLGRYELERKQELSDMMVLYECSMAD